MRRTLEDAAAVGNATSRTLFFEPRASEEFGYYDGSGWFNMLWVGGYAFETPPPLVTDQGIKPLPATGVRKLHSRTSFLYVATGIKPAMCMRLTGIGSQYLMTVKDADGNRLDGGKTYRVTLPPDIPAARFWSLTAYDNETRSTLQTPQRFPRAGSQSYPHTDGDRQPRRLDDDHLRSGTTLRQPGEQLDPDHGRQGLVPHPASLQPAPAVLRQVLARRRIRAHLGGPRPQARAGPAGRRISIGS